MQQKITTKAENIEGVGGYGMAAKTSSVGEKS